MDIMTAMGAEISTTCAEKDEGVAGRVAEAKLTKIGQADQEIGY